MTAFLVGLLLPLLATGFRDADAWPVFAALAFTALLFGVVGTGIPGAMIARRHLGALGWPRDAAGWALYRAGALRLATMTLGMICTVIATTALAAALTGVHA